MDKGFLGDILLSVWLLILFSHSFWKLILSEMDLRLCEKCFPGMNWFWAVTVWRFALKELTSLRWTTFNARRVALGSCKKNIYLSTRFLVCFFSASVPHSFHVPRPFHTIFVSCVEAPNSLQNPPSKTTSPRSTAHSSDERQLYTRSL